MDLKAIANGTIASLEKGQYTAPDGTTVEIADLITACVGGTQAYVPDELAQLREQVLAQPFTSLSTTFAIVNETTLQGCARLIAGQRYRRIGVLNFASAKHPGGGFLGGARAQEESLARSSALYFSLRRCKKHYAFHQTQYSCLYSDRMIYSPSCPVLRDDAGNWLPQPYLVDFITSPAPNAGAVTRNERDRITPTLIERAGKILALAAYRQCDALVLGAWGCGVFKNDPVTVAAIFHDYLRPQGIFGQRFQHVLFSVYDTSRTQDIYRAFARRFADLV